MSKALDPLLSQIGETLPVAPEAIALAGSRVGLIVVDVINGFARVGGGALAPRAPDPMVATTVAETNRLARWFAEREFPIAVFLDTHEPGKPEPPIRRIARRGRVRRSWSTSSSGWNRVRRRRSSARTASTASSAPTITRPVKIASSPG